jgi:uncharacterized membrane protein YtjA (UPF0391 family)
VEWLLEPPSANALSSNGISLAQPLSSRGHRPAAWPHLGIYVALGRRGFRCAIRPPLAKAGVRLDSRDRAWNTSTIASDDAESKQAGQGSAPKVSQALGTSSTPAGCDNAAAGSGLMLKWALIFFLISIVAGFFGFSGVSAATAGIAKILFIGAIIIAIIIVVAAISLGQAVF